MTDWTQFHPTEPLTTPDGQRVDIDVEMVPLVQQLWRLGFRTKVACQDAGKAVLHGGTRAPEADRPHLADRTLGRAWLIVHADQAPHLLDAVPELAGTGTWKLSSVTKDRDPRSWTSITFPRPHIPAANALLKHARHVRNPAPAAAEDPAPPPADTAPARDYG
ncbi:hypothetical protein [Actinomadura bangladeshensis]|uniref:Uncharacterized protein n=1 Tax=Actinomadura bangladeshensis TaxID=453573 RepID=A0A6L9QW07_9ACTN|nr:hypothetical protein [Actinomadura bangladeshensis]NEA29675.1 hypothetical protein [Actinomadura bangladeshensis]